MGIIGTGGVTIINNGSANTNPDGSNTPVYFANCATPSALPTCTYSNGTAGVGATLTANANGALSTTYTDGVSISVGDIILVWKQTSALQNGLYEITQIGTVSTPWILTRLSIYDTTDEVYPSQVNILYGTVYATKYFLQQTEAPTIGTSSLVYVTVTAPSPSTINQNLRLVDTYTTSPLPTCTYTPNASALTPALNAYLNATVNGVFPTLNGVAPYQYMRVLVSGQADQKQNGDYTLQNVGSASSTWRLSRTSYTASSLYPAWWGIYQGTGRGFVFEQTNSTLTNATIGVSGNITFVQAVSSPTTIYTGDGTLSGARTVTMAGNGLTFTGGQTTIKGSGTTSATKAFSVQSSAGTEFISVKDNGEIYIDNSTSLTNGFKIKTAQNAGVPVPFVITNGSNTTAQSLRISNTGGSYDSSIISYTSLNLQSESSGVNIRGGNSGGSFFQSIDLYGGTTNLAFRVDNTGRSVFTASTSWYNTMSLQSNDKIVVDGFNSAWKNSSSVPSNNIVDHCRLYASDQVAGNSCLHTRTENGAIVKLYQETTAVTSGTLLSNAGTTLTSTDTIDGYTLQQVVKALRNLGILA